VRAIDDGTTHDGVPISDVMLDVMLDAMVEEAERG
jgi:hypothetical protein